MSSCVNEKPYTAIPDMVLIPVQDLSVIAYTHPKGTFVKMCNYD